MENFRILLDLSDLEDRVHKYVWMLISTIDLKYVADFKKAVINKLALKRNDIQMFINGGLLLEEEKIMILRENDTVQIQYEKLSDLVCHSSSYMEVQDNKLSLNIEEYNGNGIVKHSKKHKRKSKEVSVEVADENIEKDLSNIEEYNGNEIAKHSKKHKRKSKEVSFEVANNNEENDLSICKRKRDVATVERFEDEILMQVENPMNGCDINAEGICNRKKRKKSFSTPLVNDGIIQNERINMEEIDTILVADDATTITLDESSQESGKLENSNTTTNDTSVGSFSQGSNCKKRKRKRNRKRRREQNLIGPFMSANMNTLQELTKENPPILDQSDHFAGIRKHIRFTSPTPDSNNKKIEILDLETNCPDSQAEILPNKTCITPNVKPLSFPTRRMYIDNANQIANKVYSTISPSLFPSLSPSFIPSLNVTSTLPTTKISSLTTSKTYIDPKNMLSPKLSRKTGIEPTSLVSTNPSNSKVSTLTEQKSLLENSQAVFSMPQENGNKSSPEVLKSNECEPLHPVIRSCEDYSPLKALPPMGTHIAFKLLELDENYTPVVSKYKEGVIKSIDPKSEELEIELIKVEIKPGRTGKFENLNEDEAPSNEVIRTVTAPWSSLIEPRLVSRS